ncbi:MAG: tetratricopeptide repeat protein [Calditrichaceae bacterium]
MISKTLSLSAGIFFFLLISFFPAAAQEAAQTDLEFNQALRVYVTGMIGDLSKESIHNERFLIEQIRLINNEIKYRVTNASKIRDQYFEGLQEHLVEIQALKQRLNSGNSAKLNQFIDELQRRIKETIRAGTIDFKKQKVIEDAIQLLYLAEEMTKLDTGARLEENPSFVKGLNRTKTNFVQSFGESNKMGISSGTGGNGNASIFDVYEEWRHTERLKYHLRWTDIQIIKNRLIKNGTADQKNRMFRNELRQAAYAYNFGFYNLAGKSFEEILKTYGTFGNLDDCVYYQSESNFALGRYSQALEGFKNLVEKYPSSVYSAQAFRRLIYLSYHFENYSNVLAYFEKMKVITSPSASYYDETLLLVTMAGLKSGDYESAVKYAYEISATSEYSRQAKFLLAEAYAGANNYEEAIQQFTNLLSISGLHPEFRFAVLLKLGYLSYETGNIDGAIRYFDLISSQFSKYDRVLIGYAWSYYKLELKKLPDEEKDFTTAKLYLDAIIESFNGSDYYLEARTLLGYINQLEENVSGALDNFEYAYGTKDVKELSDRMNEEREHMRASYRAADNLEKKSLAANNLSGYYQAREMKDKIEKPLVELTYSDVSSEGIAAKNEIKRLNEQIEELDRLKAIADEKGEKKIKNRIEDLQLKIYRSINAYPGKENSPLGINYFDEHPLARKESVIESENAKIQSLRDESRLERENIMKRISQLDVDIQKAKGSRNYKREVELELQKDRFTELLNKIDYLESWAYNLDMMHSNINLGRWSDYGAFGVANVNFSIKNSKEQDISDMQKQIEQINDFLMERKEYLEHKIGLIESEITLMTRRVRRQERLREREELNRQFEESYFDTHETEARGTQNTTAPPVIKRDSEQ